MSDSEWDSNELLAELERIDAFLEAMRERLHQKAREGYGGWDSIGYDERALPQNLMNRLESAVREERYVDTAALAGFLWWRAHEEARLAADAFATVDR